VCVCVCVCVCRAFDEHYVRKRQVLAHLLGVLTRYTDARRPVAGVGSNFVVHRPMYTIHTLN